MTVAWLSTARLIASATAAGPGCFGPCWRQPFLLPGNVLDGLGRLGSAVAAGIRRVYRRGRREDQRRADRRDGDQRRPYQPSAHRPPLPRMASVREDRSDPGPPPVGL